MDQNGGSGYAWMVNKDYLQSKVSWRVPYPVPISMARSGKITCILDIMDLAELTSTSRYYTDKYDDDGGRITRIRRRVLSNEVKRAFRNKSLVCYEYKNLTPDQEEDLFARVRFTRTILTLEISNIP